MSEPKNHPQHGTYDPAEPDPANEEVDGGDDWKAERPTEQSELDQFDPNYREVD